MEKTSTFRKNLLQKALLLPLVLLGLMISQLATAHNVTGYTAGCLTGAKYSIDPTVSQVNTSSNYAWQYKNGSSWVCIINGSNTINGNIYTVSGARSAGTDPAPIVFANPNAALDDVIIRCIISDGSNVNPCSTSNTVYNAGSDSKNFTIDVTNTSCGANNVMSLGNRVWYDKDNTGTNNNEDGIAEVVVNLYKSASDGINVDGGIIATASTDADGYYMFTNLAPGKYIVGIIPPAGYMRSTSYSSTPDDDINYDNNGFKAVGNEIRGNAMTLTLGGEPNGNSNITYDFGLLPDCSCTNASNNLLVNGNFENGTSGWYATGGSLTTGTGYIACGAANGFNNWSSGTSKVYQDVNVSPGAIITFKGFAGTHTGGIGCSPKLSLVFFNGASQLTQFDAVVSQDVDLNHSQLEQYTITATVPSNATKVRVQSTITCNVMKMDAFCLTTTSTTVGLGNTVWYDTNNDGKLNNGEAGIANATVHLYNASNTAAGAFIATATTNASGTYSFSGLTPGNYVVGVVTPAGYVSSVVNGGDPNNNIDNDDNGQVTQGDETLGLVITLSLNGEPDGNVNNTYDFGFLPDCSCTTSSNNLLVNGSFENGTTGWYATGGTITTGTGYIACGAANGFNNWSSGTSTVYQQVAVSPGATLTFKGFAGTHTGGIGCSPKLSLVFYNGSTKLSPQYDVTVDRDVDKNNSQLKQYTITATAPSNATSVQVQSTITCNVMKMDAFCLTTTCVRPGKPDGVVTQPTCSVATGTVVVNNLPTGSWTINGTNNGVAFTPVTGSGTSYTFTNVSPGTYIFTVSVPGGCAASIAETVVVDPQPATPTAPTAGIPTQPSCSVATGSVVLSGLPATGNWTITRTGTGGTATYTGSGTSLTINGLATGSYTFTVTNASGCTSPASTTVVINSQPVAPTAPVATAIQPTCTVSTGSINLTGLPSSGTYTLIQKKGSNTTTIPTSGTLTGSTYTVSGLGVGTYSYYVTPTGGCLSPASNVVTINAQPTPPTAPVAIVTQSACNTTGTYTIKLIGLPATGNWIITRTGPGTTTGNGTITSTGTSTVISGLAAGSYTFTITNADGCVSAATPVTLAQQTANAILGGKTWDDKNRDGLFTSGETVITNVAVSLFMDANGDGIGEGAPMKVANTNSSGTYSFTNLCPGNYVVGFGTADGFVRTKQPNTVSADAGDSDPDPNTGYTPTINLVAGQTDNTNDAGYYAPTILPVGFGNITAQARNCEVVLSFEVLTQKNTKQFEIGYSKDGANWNNIGIVSAKASSTAAYTYNFTHTQPAAGVNLYRIRVVDTDGKIGYSQIVSATSVCAGKGMITTYPNPAYDMLNVSLPSTYQDAQLQLFNGTGQMVISDTRKSGLIRSLNTQNLAPGIYLLKVMYNNNVVMTQKVVKGE